ncbi:MAG: 2-oxoacid:acceptor oxidoreductase subunit alpha [Candidatus Latescibacter sp.]|nr:2-oxoacid:acceptor oxidoreductase subunit alpha [Candidatus Latescibacter sp.]
MEQNISQKSEISIVLCGEAGQGIQTVESLMTTLLKISGYHFFSTKEYMSRIRGGSNSTEIRVSSAPVKAFVERIDILFPLTLQALEHVRWRLTADTLIIGEKAHLAGEGNDPGVNIFDVPFSSMAKEVGGEIYSNVIAVGIIAGILGIDRGITNEFLGGYFGRKGEAVVKNNIAAMGKGYEIGRRLFDEGIFRVDIKTHPEINDDIVMNGAEAIGFGALWGGCNFISAYPMTPSTGILNFLAARSLEFDVIAEQAEDEIAAINMALGAWYAGARGMVCTAGGGFALMAEGVSLAGMLESPVVISVGQRPAPATGLPTRTEQGDLEFVLHAGHGEFPRVIFAPGTIEDCIDLTRRAFNLADKYQIPVFILSDQYIIDTYYNFPAPDLSVQKIEHQFVKTDKDFSRYAITESGVSPRGIPGYGEGVVVLDSDEHDIRGHITEDYAVRTAMVNKRLRKMDQIVQEAIPPELTGSQECEYLVVCWGSTYHIAREAIQKLGRDDISLLHFKQVYPLHRDTPNFFSGAKRTIIIENNATSQFGRILREYTGIAIDKKILQYNGLPFSVEHLTEALKAEAEQEVFTYGS